MSVDEDVQALMALVSEYGEMREWHGARPGDDMAGKLDAAEAAVRNALQMRMAIELATLAPAIAQLEAGDVASALKMLQRRAECIAGPNVF